jgi:hypothetical protein
MGKYFNVPQQPRTMDALNEGLQNILLLRQQQTAKNQKRMSEINKELEALDPVKLSEERDQLYAAEAIKKVHELAANSMTYNKEGKPKKIRDFFYGPELDDMEQAEIYKLINTEAAEIAKRKSSNDLMKKEAEEFNRNQDKYDTNYYNKQMERYRNEPGYVPEGKSYLSIAPNLNIEDALSDPKNDPRTESEKKGSETPDGNYIVTTTPSALPEQQSTVYNAKLRSDPALAKGAVYRFIDDTSKTYEEKRAYIAGSLVKRLPDDPKIREQMLNMALQKADKVMADFRDDVKVAPELIDAAIFWGENDQKWQENVGKGGESRELNQGAYNDMLRRQREKSDKAAEIKVSAPQARTYVAGDIKLGDFVDTGTSSPEKNTLSTKLPTGTMRFSRTGKTKELSKKFEGQDKQKNYKIAGYDKKAGWIILHDKLNADDEDMGYEYLVPYRSNEWMINEIQKQNKDVNQSVELEENYFNP